MTVKEFYEWAKENGVENREVAVEFPQENEPGSWFSYDFELNECKINNAMGDKYVVIDCTESVLEE